MSRHYCIEACLLLSLVFPAGVSAEPGYPSAASQGTPRRPVLFIPTLPAPVPSARDVPTAGTPLALPLAIRLAFEHNPDILTTQLAIRQAQAQLHLAEVQWYPSSAITLSGNEGSSGLGQGFGPGTQSNSADLTLTQTVTDFGRTRAAMQAAQASLQAAQANLLKKQEDVALLVSQQYFTTIANEELASIAGDSVADQEKHLEQTLAFYESGTKAGLDVAQSRSSLATAQLALVEADNSRDTSYVTLNNAMGFDSDSAYQLNDAVIQRVADNVATDAPVVPDAATLVADGDKHRPDVMALDAQILAAQADLDLARLGLGPRLTSSGSLSLFNASGQSNPSWSLGLVLSLPILDSNNTRYTIELDQAILDTLLAQRVSLQNTVYQQVKVDVLSVHQSISSISVAREGVEAARQAFNLADERYKVGLGSQLDYLDAQLAYVQARSTLVSAQASLESSNAQLSHDVGRTEYLESLLENEHG